MLQHLQRTRSYRKELYKYLIAITSLYCILCFVGCVIIEEVRVNSVPSGAKVTFYDKNGNEINHLQRILPAEATLYYDDGQQILSSSPFSIYTNHRSISHLGAMYNAIPTSEGRYKISPVERRGSGKYFYDWGSFQDESGRPITIKFDNVTPFLLFWDTWNNRYHLVKYEITGYPSQTRTRKDITIIEKREVYNSLNSRNETRANGILSVDFTKEVTTNASGQNRASSPTAHPSAQSGDLSIETILSKAVQNATIRIIKNSVIAVVPFASSDNNFSDFLTGETEYLLVGQGFSVVDRGQLDRIRTEQRLQLSGEIDSATISSIGRFSGADYIVTGQIDGRGSLQRLRLQVLEVQTADVVGTASEQYGDSPIIANPIGINDAIQQAIMNATTSVSPNSRLAIVEISANSSINSFIYGESEYMLKNKGFRIVDRAQLDRVRAEQSMQQSSEFDDKTVANIGKLAGADYLITIRVDGRGGLTRLRWRILDTQTALVAGVASVHFSSDVAPVVTPLTLDNARKSALEQATARVTKDARLAIVQFNSTDTAMRGENVVYSLENDLVNSGFRVVDRSQLDTIRAEQRYQRSGEVDSRTAVDIGKFAGARYIVTGSIDGAGSLRRFRLRVLDTETAEVVGVASVSY